MYMLSIVFGPSPVPWGMLFRDKELADAAYKEATRPGATTISIADEFGQHATLNAAAVHGVMLEDMEKSKLGMIERALHQERLKVKANEMARVDPVLKTAAMTQGAPILQPFGGRPNGGF
jgi:hypothetical protein